MTATKSALLTLAVLPRDARIPSDFNALLSVCPIEATIATHGRAYLDSVKARYIGSLITDSLSNR